MFAFFLNSRSSWWAYAIQRKTVKLFTPPLSVAGVRLPSLSLPIKLCSCDVFTMESRSGNKTMFAFSPIIIPYASIAWDIVSMLPSIKIFSAVCDLHQLLVSCCFFFCMPAYSLDTCMPYLTHLVWLATFDLYVLLDPTGYAYRFPMFLLTLVSVRIPGLSWFKNVRFALRVD